MGSILNQIKQNNEVNPDKVAIENAFGKRISYHQFIELENLFSKTLKAYLGSNRIRCALIMEDEMLFTPISLSLLENHTYISINPRYSIDQITRELELFKIQVIITDVDLSKSLAQVDVSIFKFSFKNTFIFETIKSKKAIERFEDDYSYLNKTSGTTSLPKIFGIKYEGIVERHLLSSNFLNLGTSKDTLTVVELYRVASVLNIIRSLQNNRTAYFTNGIVPFFIINLLKSKNIDKVLMPTAALILLNKYLSEENITIINNRSIVFTITGSLVDLSIVRNLKSHMNCKVYNMYAMTEVYAISIINVEEIKNKYSVGKCIIPVRIKDGEVQVKVNYFYGYENYSNENIFDDGWFKTGDLGDIQNEELFIRGRIKEMINRGGEKVSPFELEAYIQEIDGVFEVAVFPYDVSSMNENVGVAVVLKNRNELSLIEIRTYLAQKLNSYKLPTCLFVVDQIPKNDDVKIQRSQYLTS